MTHVTDRGARGMRVGTLTRLLRHASDNKHHYRSELGKPTRKTRRSTHRYLFLNQDPWPGPSCLIKLTLLTPPLALQSQPTTRKLRKKLLSGRDCSSMDAYRLTALSLAVPAMIPRMLSQTGGPLRSGSMAAWVNVTRRPF